MSTTQMGQIEQDDAFPIASFFSDLQLRRMRQAQQDRQSFTVEQLQGAFLFIDMVAFTRLGERLGQHGAKGAEDLSELLHAYYRPILSSIRDHGGDVQFFAGDALGVAWIAEDGDISKAAGQAAQCALDIQSFVPRIRSNWPEPLAFRVALGVGPLEDIEVGGQQGEWLQLVRGEAIDLAYKADTAGAGGTVTVSQDCARHLEPFAPNLAELPNGFLRLDALGEPVETHRANIPALAGSEEAALQARLPEAAHRLLTYASSAVAAEFRRITVVFADISGTDTETLDKAVKAAQRDVKRFDGNVYQLLEDDKGTKLIIVFGSPGASHDDDHLRALLLAQQLGQTYQDIGISARYGIASGTAFCGPLGSSERQQYSVIGSCVNLAARLMTLASAGQIYCDSQTRKLAGDAFGFEEAAWITPKGFPEPVPVFQPGKRNLTARTRTTSSDIVGRDAELSQISNHIDDVAAGGDSRLMVIEAEAGLGKSALLNLASTAIQEKSCHPLQGFADAFEAGTAYFAFRNIARFWCAIEPHHTPDEALGKIQNALRDAPDLLELAPLMGPVLGLEIAETELTEALRGQIRSENTQRILLHLAQKSISQTPYVLLIEDAHWMDGASWAFLEHLLENATSLFVLMSSRPFTPALGEAERLLQHERTEIIALNPIDRTHTETMIKGQLGVSAVSPEALAFVHGRAEGNPLFVREIVKNLLETGDIQIRDGRLQLLRRQIDADFVPDTLDGVITSRIDRLATDAQVTIKAAAVLGRSFEAETLLAIHPLSIDRGFLDDQLAILTQNGFLVATGEAAEFTFHHALTRDAAYNLLSFAQRESLHRKTAVTLETKYNGNTERVNGRLGYHFRMAGMKEKAAPYLAAAGETALDAYASQDAIELLSSALQLDEEHRGKDVVDDLTRTHWCRLLGEAYYNQDNQPEAAIWYRRAMDAAGVSPKRPLLSIIPTLMRAVFAPTSLNRPPNPDLTEEDKKRIAEGIASGRELGTIYLWESDVGRFALNAVNLVRVTRFVGLNEESGPANATLGFMMSAAGLRTRSEDVALQAVDMARGYEGTNEFVSANVVCAMVLTQNGTPSRAVPYFEKANQATSTMVSGMWRHRASYMLADAITWLGQYRKAHELFLSAASISHGAEPHTVALSTAMAALTQLRMGRPEQAVTLLEGPEGVPHALACDVPFAKIMTLGILAEARLALGQKEAALQAAKEAVQAGTKKDDGTGYYSCIFSYSSVLNVFLQITDDSGKPTDIDAPEFAKAMKLMKKLSGTAPLGKAAYHLWHGVWLARTGKTAQAVKSLKTAKNIATKAQQPFELGRSLIELCAVSQGEARNTFLTEAIDVFQNHAMPLEEARARAYLQQ